LTLKLGLTAGAAARSGWRTGEFAHGGAGFPAGTPDDLIAVDADRSEDCDH
jgi:hypothetical protein